ncbi:hypothetical protein KGO95_03340 [Patescibacteria group bacterium]|nr:hypothetical protein [Patescibacteria group bacterium]
MKKEHQEALRRLYPQLPPEQIVALDTLLDRYAAFLWQMHARVTASDEAWNEFLALTEGAARSIVEEEPSHQRSKIYRRDQNV